jgi:hypothetical protein
MSHAEYRLYPLKVLINTPDLSPSHPPQNRSLWMKPGNDHFQQSSLLFALISTPDLRPGVQQDSRDNADSDDERSTDTRTWSDSDILEYGGKPEGSVSYTVQGTTG